MGRKKVFTEKMQRFCQELIANGGKQAEAYLAAYDGSSYKSASIESTRLLEREDVQAYLKKLRQPIEKAVIRKMINERDYKKRVIQERLEACIEREDDAGAARWMDIWNRMDGEYVNINKDITDHQAEIVNLDTATLQKLAKVD